MPSKKQIKPRDDDPADPLEAPAAKKQDHVLKLMNPDDVRRRVHKLMKLTTFEPEQRFWLDTGTPELNATLGSRKLGLPYGKLYELRGPEHGGKTTVSTILAGIAQKGGAAVIYIDLEDSYDPMWSRRLGLQPEYLYLITPKLVKAKGEDEPVLQSAESMFVEAERVMKQYAKQGFERFFILLDSVANLQTEMVIEAGMDGMNMRTRTDRATFLSTLLPRWTGLAANYNAMLVMINQLYEKPGVAWGDPTESPGGRRLRTCCHIRCNVKRLKGGKVLQSGKTVGLVSKLSNFKNKAGAGSVQDEQCGFKVVWNRDPAIIKFMTASSAEIEVERGKD